MTTSAVRFYSKLHLALCSGLLGLGFSLNFQLRAQIIDFETLPNGNNTAGGMLISNQYAAAFGISFQFADGSFPVIRRVGGSFNGKPTAFYGWPNDTSDNGPAPGQNVGISFITDDRVVNAPPPPLVISYAQPVAAASAFILDIDHLEAWDVYAYNSATQVLAVVHLEHDTRYTGDGIATPWSFRRPTADIASIRVVFAGNTNDNVGLAFDSFSTSTPLPTPAPPWLTLSLVSNKVSLVLTGTVAAVYGIESANSPSSTNWTPVTSVVLLTNSAAVTNVENVGNSPRFYRAVGAQ